jgi:hypothetical protein
MGGISDCRNPEFEKSTKESLLFNKFSFKIKKTSLLKYIGNFLPKENTNTIE